LNLNGFTYQNLSLINIQFFWIEGQDGIEDFLSDQTLPESLPPTTEGRIALYFVDSQGGTHNAFYNVDLTFTGEVEPQELESGSILKFLPLIIEGQTEQP